MHPGQKVSSSQGHVQRKTAIRTRTHTYGQFTFPNSRLHACSCSMGGSQSARGNPRPSAVASFKLELVWQTEARLCI